VSKSTLNRISHLLTVSYISLFYISMSLHSFALFNVQCYENKRTLCIHLCGYLIFSALYLCTISGYCTADSDCDDGYW
jgi:hypothetical protein